METTNSVFNTSLFDHVDASGANTLPYWLRVTVANRGATTAKDWHDIFYQYNSGTYNNQWMTVDYKVSLQTRVAPRMNVVCVCVVCVCVCLLCVSYCSVCILLSTHTNSTVFVFFFSFSFHKLFTPMQPLPANLFWVSEQIPGHHHAEDQTMALQRGHWYVGKRRGKETWGRDVGKRRGEEMWGRDAPR